MLFTVTTILHASILLLAIVIPNIDIVFEITGSIACPSIIYLFPAIGYLVALNKYGTEAKRSQSYTKMFSAVSWVFIVFGTFSIVGYLTFIIL